MRCSLGDSDAEMPPSLAFTVVEGNVHARRGRPNRAGGDLQIGRPRRNPGQVCLGLDG